MWDRKDKGLTPRWELSKRVEGGNGVDRQDDPGPGAGGLALGLLLREAISGVRMGSDRYSSKQLCRQIL